MHPLRFPNSGIRAKRLPATTSSQGVATRDQPAEVAGHDQAPYRGGRPWPGYLQGATALKGSNLQGAASPQGVAPATSPIASRGDGASRRGGRPLAGRLPTAKGSRRLRRGSGSDGAVRVMVGWGIFLSKRWLCPSEFEKF
ncbi:hypothetical protein BHE74_00058953 [Ensete ventricosum]|nr:hypothetical protein BHE74_00058953 [Ensete ventricosum]